MYTGNTISVYNKTGALPLTQTEVHLYGSSRLAIHNLNTDVQNCAANSPTVFNFTRGHKFFELANHLGNVLVTVSDKKIAVDVSPANGTTDYYTADVITVSDYYPFGMAIPSRKYKQANSGSGYRYGFNGKENDHEVSGTGNKLDFGARIYDSRLGRWLSVDPLQKKYPGESPYLFSGGNPIFYKDIDGKDRIVTITVERADGTTLQFQKSFPDEYEFESHYTERGIDYYKKDIIVNIYVKLPATAESYKEAMKNPDNIISETRSESGLIPSSFAETHLGVLYRFFSNINGDESGSVVPDRWRVYGNGTDGSWHDGLPRAGPGSESIDLSSLLTIAGMAKGAEKPIDLIEHLKYEPLVVLMKVLDQQTKKVENLTTSIEETKKQLGASKASLKVGSDNSIRKDSFGRAPIFDSLGNQIGDSSIIIPIIEN